MLLMMMIFTSTTMTVQILPILPLDQINRDIALTLHLRSLEPRAIQTINVMIVTIDGDYLPIIPKLIPFIKRF